MVKRLFAFLFLFTMWIIVWAITPFTYLWTSKSIQEIFDEDFKADKWPLPFWMD